MRKTVPAMRYTYYGHSCYLLETKGLKLLFDPFISYNPKAAHIDIESIKPDFILLSHGHFDHVADLVTIYNQSQAKVISNFEIGSYYEQKHQVNHVHKMNIGGAYDFPFGKLRMTQAIHSSTFIDFTPAGSPAGFIISNSEGTVYYSGDTALFADMKILGEMYNPQVAFLSLGDNYTMGYTEALKAAKWMGIKKVFGMHFDTFPEIEIDKKAALERAADKNITLVLPNIGESGEVIN